MSTPMDNLVSALESKVRQFIRRRVRDSDIADDLTQDVFLKVQANLRSKPSDERLSVWVFAIARNTVTDHYRREAIRRHEPITDQEISASDTTTESDVAVKELSHCAAHMIGQMPRPYQDALRLSDLDGASQREVARRQSISLSGVKSRVQRARQQLRQMVLDCCTVARDARGSVMDYQTTQRSARYCESKDSKAPEAAERNSLRPSGASSVSTCESPRPSRTEQDL